MAGDALPQEARLQRFERLQVTVGNFAALGCILDVGGGGEGIVGRLKGGRAAAKHGTRLLPWAQRLAASSNDGGGYSSPASPAGRLRRAAALRRPHSQLNAR